jgi:hypothetical protein
MKTSLLAASAVVLAAQAPSHALFGLGVSYGQNFTTIDGTHETIGAAQLPPMLAAYGPEDASMTLHRGSLSGLTQVGLKTWLDLPLIPVEFEGAANVSFGAYESSAKMFNGVDTVTVPVSIDIPLDLAGAGEGKTPYTSLALDVSVRYPFLTLPPLSPLKPLKFYVGAGASWFYATRVVSQEDLKELFPGAPEGEVTESMLKDALKDNISESSFGGHVLLGAQFKVPVLPLAVFVDGKWYFNAATSDAASNNPLAVSGGVAFAL